ncbi:MAG: DUF2235 domain-containing protein [bacterium]|nr:DUF2235 domain-containing protein [bacterium]
MVGPIGGLRIAVAFRTGDPSLEGEMGKNIVLLSDGTGNSAAKLFRTNVWRLYEALDRSDPTAQVAYYDDGIGTSSFRPLAAVTGIFGIGLKRNVLDLYRFLCRNHAPGDRIYCFGFSRGAFTARVLAGFIADQGIVPYAGDEAALVKASAAAYRRFRKRFDVSLGLVGPLRRLRDWVLRDPPSGNVPATVEFVGVWDTVAAYGGPIEEITRAVDHWVWPLSMPDRFMSSRVRRGCHAIALDDERNSFHPLLWDEEHLDHENGPPLDQHGSWTPPGASLPPIDQQRISQVWFTGMHSDVGGGYAQDGLAYKALDWMIDRASVYGLHLEASERQRIRERARHLDRMNDSRRGVVGGYYRYKPRRIADILARNAKKATLRGDLAHMMHSLRGGLPVAAAHGSNSGPMIHESVFERIRSRSDGYAPIVLPGVYRETSALGGVRALTPPDVALAAARAEHQELAWDWVWARRVVYFATLLASLVLLALPWVDPNWPIAERGLGGDTVGSKAHLLAELVPGPLSPWANALVATPIRFALVVALLVVLMESGRHLEGRINNAMRQLWDPAVLAQRMGSPVVHGLLYRTRTSKYYRGFFYALTNWIVPTLLAIGFYGVLMIVTLWLARAFAGVEASALP